MTRQNRIRIATVGIVLALCVVVPTTLWANELVAPATVDTTEPTTTDTLISEPSEQVATDTVGTSTDKGDTSETSITKVDTTSAKETTDEKGSGATTSTPHVTNISASVAFVGLDGDWERVSGLSLAQGSNAWDATLSALQQSDLTYETGAPTSKDVLASLTRSDGESCSTDTTSGSGWHLYINDSYYEGSASSYSLRDGDQVEWRYEIASFDVSVSVIGPGGTDRDYWVTPTTVTVFANQTAWDASWEVFDQNGYSGKLLSFNTDEAGSITLESLASLGSNGITGETWHVFVNGETPETNVAQLNLRAGDSICWYYSGNGENNLPTFAEKTGAASQSPATRVHLEGTVTQTWTSSNGTTITNGGNDPVDILKSGSGVSVTGSVGAQSLANVTSPLEKPLDASLKPGIWNTSLAHLLDNKMKTGSGGRAALMADGSLYYLDNVGSVIKLELSQP